MKFSLSKSRWNWLEKLCFSMLTLSEFVCNKSNAIKYNGSRQTIVLGQDFQCENQIKTSFWNWVLYMSNIQFCSMVLNSISFSKMCLMLVSFNSKSELQTNKSWIFKFFFIKLIVSKIQTAVYFGARWYFIISHHFGKF